MAVTRVNNGFYCNLIVTAWQSKEDRQSVILCLRWLVGYLLTIKYTTSYLGLGMELDPFMRPMQWTMRDGGGERCERSARGCVYLFFSCYCMEVVLGSVQCLTVLLRANDHRSPFDCGEKDRELYYTRVGGHSRPLWIGTSSLDLLWPSDAAGDN